MKVIYNNLIPIKGFKAINLFGILFVRKGSFLNEVDINHERIHTEQWKEMFYIGFLLWYVLEWLIRLFIYFDSHKAYRNISFEREAYSNQTDMSYHNSRKRFSWFQRIKK